MRVGVGVRVRGRVGIRVGVGVRLRLGLKGGDCGVRSRVRVRLNPFQ